MSNKVKERRELKIEEAVKAGDWNEVSRLLQQEQSNAERRDRYHHKRSMEEHVSRKDTKQRERHEFVASSDLTPEEALLQKERAEMIKSVKDKILTPRERDIVEMIAEHQLSKKETARHISKKYGKTTDVTINSHYNKAINKLKQALEGYYNND